MDAFLKIQNGPRSGDLSIVEVPEYVVPGQIGTQDKEVPQWSIIAGSAAARHCPLFGLAREISSHLGGLYFKIEDLKAETLVEVLKQEVIPLYGAGR